MKHLIAIFLILIISITSIDAKDIKGVVVNRESIPLQNASVYLKNNPYFKVFTDDSGEFVLNLESIKYSEEDKLIFSHIGYETKEYQIKEMIDSAYHKIILLESSILLDDVTVTVQKKTITKRAEESENFYNRAI